MLKNAILLLFMSVLRIAAQSTLSGDIGGRTFIASGSPWYVTENISIKKGSSVVIKEGCVFLFKPFTGIKVYGALSVQGSRENPVVFTSVHDNTFNLTAQQAPNPFDWNGIIIHKSAKNVSFMNVQLSYSVYGIKSRKEAVRIDNGIFRQNGQFHFTINDTIKPVQDGLPYFWNKDGKIRDADVSKRTIVPGTVVKITTGVVGTGCVIASVPFLLQARTANKNGNAAYLQHEIDGYWKKERRALLKSAAAGLPGLLLIGTSIALYVFDKQKDGDNGKVSVAPYTSCTATGLAFVAIF